MSTTVIYDIIPRGGTAARYRESARFVANMDTRGVFSNIEVVVRWGGHEGRMPICGERTLDSLSKNTNGVNGLRWALAYADRDALKSLIRSATDAHTGAVDEITDFEAVRTDVAAALGVDPFKQRVPVTLEEVSEWRSWFVAEDFFDLGDA